MAALKVANYQTIASLYASAQRQIANVADYYYEAAYEIVSLVGAPAFAPELDLLTPFYSAYLSTQTIFSEPPQAIVSAITSLQNHILSKATDADGTRFSDINDWIDAAGSNGVNDLSVVEGRADDDDASFTVDAEFASLSAIAGFTIDQNNIG